MQVSIWHLFGQAMAHTEWPVHVDIFNHYLVSRCPLWTDTVPFDINKVWFEAWESATVISPLWQTLQSGKTWFWPSSTDMVCTESLPRPLCCKSTQWGLASSDKCECGMVPTMSHILSECPKTVLFDGGLQRFHCAISEAVNLERKHSQNEWNHFWDIARYWLKIANFNPHHLYFVFHDPTFSYFWNNTGMNRWT